MNLSRLNQPKQPWSPFKYATVVFLIIYFVGNIVGYVVTGNGTGHESAFARGLMIAERVIPIALIPAVIAYFVQNRRR
ncbi:MAG TPA: hypothetical protein VIV11_35630 [Kofleriaceae bacterium]